MQRSYLKLDDKSTVWCPKLAVMRDGKMIAASKFGWINYLSDDWNYIYEINEDVSVMSGKELYLSLPRITFTQSKDTLGRIRYRFGGVYKLSADISLPEKKHIQE